MSPLSKATLMILGGACLLLFAGAFPLMGAPELYRGGAMLAIGLLAALLALWGGWKLTQGQRARFLLGALCTFFTCSGLVTAWQFGAKAISYLPLGGSMWFGALGMGCIAVVGLLFTAIFGFLMFKLMNKRLWLAGAHWSLFLMAGGSYLDYFGEITAPLYLPDDGKTEQDGVVTEEGQTEKLGFSLRVDDFAINHYEPTYTLYEHRQNQWNPLASLTPQNGELSHEGESWNVSTLADPHHTGRPFKLLQGTTLRLLMQDTPTVKEYRATCKITRPYRGRKEEYTAPLRVNEPISCNGWQIYLMSYRPMGTRSLLILQARHSPGRLLSLAGMTGLILCTACWCWWKKEKPSLLPPQA